MTNHPNRSKGPKVELDQILAARKAADLTQKQAGSLIYATERTWQDWESGRRRMPYAALELFLLRTGQIDLEAL